MQPLHGTGNGGAMPGGFHRINLHANLLRIMRKVLDTKAGAAFHEEMNSVTLCIRKECIELIYKLKPGRFMIINLVRSENNEVLLMANWGNFFNRLQNPDVQIPKIKQCCPTLYGVLSGEDTDEIFHTSCGKETSELIHGLAMTCKVDENRFLISCITNEVLRLANKLVDKNISIYNELSSNPPFPAWKDGLTELWNG